MLKNDERKKLGELGNYINLGIRIKQNKLYIC